MNIEYEIKYLNGDDIIKLEKYLHHCALYETQKHLYFKIDDERKTIKITDKNGYISIAMSLTDFVNKTVPTLKMFFKFKDIEKDFNFK